MSEMKNSWLYELLARFDLERSTSKSKNTTVSPPVVSQGTTLLCNNHLWLSNSGPQSRGCRGVGWGGNERPLCFECSFNLPTMRL